jgi:hypothetical protein
MITGRFLNINLPIVIHLCKDRTLSYRDRTKNEPIFNGVAVPVLSVGNRREAHDLILLVGTRQYGPHPNPNYLHEHWMKLFNGIGGWKPYLEPEDVPKAEKYLYDAYQRILEIRNANAA